MFKLIQFFFHPDNIAILSKEFHLAVYDITPAQIYETEGILSTVVAVTQAESKICGRQ